MRIVLASSNAGKLTELRVLLADLPVELVSLADALTDPPSLVEDEDTFEGNALSKARQASRATGHAALADDSGLEVDALGGRPGVRSARFASEHATDAENNAELLRQLEGFRDSERSARFRCVLALLDPTQPDEPRIAHGQCAGHVARVPRGNNGFGYDPLFLVDGYDGRTMAELAVSEKNAVSHRSRAAHALRPLVVELLERRSVR
jgi:XTP/dITP diphosphohydrolase